MNGIISNFQSPMNYLELLDCWESGAITNIDILLHDADDLYTEWTVDKGSAVGDLVFLMCAKTSIDHIRHATVEAKKYGNSEIIDFAEREKKLYAQNAGSIMAYGTIVEDPYPIKDGKKASWFAKMELKLLEKPLNIAAFREFISISKFGAITKLSADQFSSLLELLAVNDSACQKLHASTLKKQDLKKYAEKYSGSVVKMTTVTTSQYQRNHYIAQDAKERADGTCQLCKQPAPFLDKDGKPYLESHHIVWLSKGGEDSRKNTVALCPNCHKKMHIVNDLNDIKTLQQNNIL